MNRVKPLRSAAFRLLAAYFVVFATATVIFFTVIFLRVGSELKQHLKQRVKATHAQMLVVAKSEGLDALINIVEQQSTARGEVQTIALLTNAQGEVIAGDLQPIPYFSGWEFLEWTRIKFIRNKPRLDPEDRFYALWRPVLGQQLLIGHSDEDIVEARKIMLRSISWGLGFNLLITIAGGLWLSRKAQTRIRAINTTLEAIAQGKMDHRIPLTGIGDDLDQVSIRINQTIDQLGALMSSMRQVSTDIAHDLKTPIGHLKQRLETARRTAKTVKDYERVLDDASGKIDTIVETFEALLRVAQIEAGARKARFTEVDLNDVMANVAEAYEQVGEDQGFKFTTNLAVAKPSTIHGDRELLIQLFANLLENAFNHCPPGTEVNIRLLSNSHGPSVHITDTGPGIPVEERENVFRRLYRLEKSRTLPGNGLGLSLVSAIAELHNIKVELSDNEPGLCVSIQFPEAKSNTYQ